MAMIRSKKHSRYHISEAALVSIKLTLLFMSTIFVSLCSQAEGLWKQVENVTIEKTNRSYLRGVGYYTDNSFNASNDIELSDTLRLVVLDSSHAVLNANGSTDAGEAYFDVMSIEDSIRIAFQPKRGRFDYNVALYEYIEMEADSDEDGWLDEEDICPDDASNSCIEIQGVVYGAGASINSASVNVGNSREVLSTDLSGEFTALVGNFELSNDSLDDFFPVRVDADGFSSGYAKVVYQPGKTEYAVTITLQQISDVISEDDDLNAGVEILDSGVPVGGITIPDAALPVGVTEVSGTITYLDPESNDILSTPGGDLLALPADSDPNEDDPVSLETFGMMEFNLKDQDGNEIHELSDMAEICMNAPSNLSFGETVPLWYYDESVGLWIEEGMGEVVERNNKLQICGEVNHFSWWNYDRPITSHSCMYYDVQNISTNDAVDNLEWQVEGVTYSGSSPARACESSNKDSAFDSITVKISTNNDAPEKIRMFTLLGGSKFYLSSVDNETYTLTQEVSGASVFQTPTENGSCISGNETGNCLPLDHEHDADGIIHLDTNINLPPVITDIFVSDSTLFPGMSAQLETLIVDPEGTEVSVSWDYYCNYYGNESYSATLTEEYSEEESVFSATFTSPSQLNSPLENCRITITAEDADGVTSEASRWITIASSLVFEVSGTVFDTYGAPLANQEMTYRNWYCGEFEESLTVSTDDNGAYLFNVDLNSCFEANEYGYIGAGILELEYERNGQTWSSQTDLYGITDFYNPFNVCVIDDIGITVCQGLDIRLPTLWTNIFGTYFPENEITNVPEYANQYIEVGVYEYSYNVSTRHTLFLNDIDLLGSEVEYGPIEVPFTGPNGGSWLYIWDGTNWVDSHFRTNSIDGTRVDINDNLTIPLQVTVYQPDDENISFDNLTLEIGQQATNYEQEVGALDANNQYFSDVFMGQGDIELRSNDQYLAYKYLGVNNASEDKVVIDFYSPDECKFEGTLFDLFGDAVPNTELEMFSVTGYSGTTITTETDDTGSFSFQTSADRVGLIAINNEFLEYWYEGINVDNCRPENEQPRVIRWDIQQPAPVSRSVNSEIFE